MIGPRELFLSHNSNNRRFAAKLARVLRAHGIPVWYSDTSITGAQEWNDKITEALDRCDWFAVVLSPQAAQSKWVKREVIYALGADQYNDKIVPILYRPCDFRKISFALNTIQYVDFRADHQNGYRNLLRIWGIGYNGSK